MISRILLILIGAMITESILAQTKSVFPSSVWRETSPERVGVDRVKLDSAIQHLESKFTDVGRNQLVIVRNGYVIFQGKDAGKIVNVYSVAKSLTSTVLGLAIHDKKLSLDDKAFIFFPSLKAQYPAVTIRHFTTMTSGYRGQNKTDLERLDINNPWELTPGKPIFEPGKATMYSNDGMRMLSAILTKQAGVSLYDYFMKKVGKDIGITSLQWPVIDHVNNIPLCSGSDSVFSSALDLARIGLLYLNEGNWNGKQLIEKEWIKEATKVQVSNDIALKELPGWGDRIDGRGLYGFNWWVNNPMPDRYQYVKGAPTDMYRAMGLMNNYLFVIPSWDMVIVKTGGDLSGNQIPVWSKFFEVLASGVH